MSEPNDELQKKINQLKKEKERLDAEKALIDAQKALDQAKSASAQQVTDLQNEKALADAKKALADAQTQAAVAKYIGDVKAGPYSGTVDMKDKAGTEEGLLLAARAVKECASRVAKAVQDKAAIFYIFGAKEFPSFQRLITFRFRNELIEQAFAAAGISKPTEGALAVAAAPALISGGLDAFSKILGFFKTDFTIGGTDAKLDESLLLFSVAGELSEKTVHLLSVYELYGQNRAVAALTSELAQLVDLRARAASAVVQTTSNIAEVEKKAADPANAATKDGLLAAAAALKPRLDQLNGVISLYDSFATSLITPDTNGAIPLTAITQELAIDAALRGDRAEIEEGGAPKADNATLKVGRAVLLLSLENSGGGYLLKKNLLTGLGAMPLYHMGGATVTYLLLSGLDGQVLAGDVIPIYGGFVRTDNLRNELAREIK